MKPRVPVRDRGVAGGPTRARRGRGGELHGEQRQREALLQHEIQTVRQQDVVLGHRGARGNAGAVAQRRRRRPGRDAHQVDELPRDSADQEIQILVDQHDLRRLDLTDARAGRERCRDGHGRALPQEDRVFVIVDKARGRVGAPVHALPVRAEQPLFIAIRGGRRQSQVVAQEVHVRGGARAAADLGEDLAGGLLQPGRVVTRREARQAAGVDARRRRREVGGEVAVLDHHRGHRASRRRRQANVGMPVAGAADVFDRDQQGAHAGVREDRVPTVGVVALEPAVADGIVVGLATGDDADRVLGELEEAAALDGVDVGGRRPLQGDTCRDAREADVAPGGVDDRLHREGDIE